MTMPIGVDDVLARLEDWYRFPKYQLERRVDIFLTFFLEPFFEREARLLLGHRHDDAQVSLVAPEFPLLSEILKIEVPASRAAPRPDLSKVKARTVNADYLLYRWAPRPAWLLVELKTDQGSFDDTQLRRYERARDLGMVELQRHLREKVRPATDDGPKYDHLIRRLDDFPLEDETPVEVVYLAPRLPRDPRPPAPPLGILPASDWTYGMAAPRLHRVRDLEKVGPFEPADLWSPLARLLRVVTPEP